MPHSNHDSDSRALPYPETEIEYQDHDPDAPPPRAPSRTSNPPLNLYSLRASSSNSNSNSNSNPISNPGTDEHEQQDQASDEKNGDSNEKGGDSPVPFYRRRRFWCICSIATTIFLAAFIPLFLYVLLPKIAQFMISRVDMQVLQVNMTDFQEGSVDVSLHARIPSMPSFIGGKVVFLKPVQVFWVRTPDDQLRAGQVSLGTIEKKANTPPELKHEATFMIDNPQIISQFSNVLLTKKQFVGRAKTVVDATAFGWTIKNLEVDKTMALDGLTSFPGVKIKKFDIPSFNDTGVFFSVSASVENPTFVGLALGYLEVAMNLGKVKLGKASVRDMSFTPYQPFVVNLEGVIYKQTDPDALIEIGMMIGNYLMNRPTVFTGQGVAVLPDGIHSVSWMTAAIVSTKMSLPILGPWPWNMFKDMTFKDMSMVMTEQQPWAPTVASTSMTARLQLPFNMSYSILDIWDPQMTLGYQNVPIADVSAGVWDRANSDVPRNLISIALPPAPVSIRPEARDAFAKLLTALTQQDSAMLDIKGSIKTIVLTPIGQLNLTLPLNVELPMQGANFNKLTSTIGNFEVASANVNTVIINATVLIDNPTIFAVEAGPATLHIKSTAKGTTDYLGYTTVANLKMVPGRNALPVLFHFQPQNPAIRDALLTEYIAGRGFDALLYGDAGSSSIASLAPIAEKFKIAASIPGMTPPPKLILGGSSDTTVDQFAKTKTIMVEFQVQNPLSSPLWVHEVLGNVTWKGSPIGSFHIEQTTMINAAGVSTSPPVGIQISTSYQFWMFMLSTFIPQNPQVLAGATVAFDLDAEILATVGGDRGVGYEARVGYSQKDVEMSLKFQFNLAGAAMRRRKRSLWKRGMEYPEIYEENFNILDELEPEPDKEDLGTYLEWLKRAVRLSYPDEAAADGWSI